MTNGTPLDPKKHFVYLQRVKYQQFGAFDDEVNTDLVPRTVNEVNCFDCVF